MAEKKKRANVQGAEDSKEGSNNRSRRIKIKKFTESSGAAAKAER